MTADEFANVVRAGSDKLRVDDVVVDTGGNQLRGRGLLRIEREEISIDLTLADPSTAATMPRKRVTTTASRAYICVAREGTAMQHEHVVAEHKHLAIHRR